MNPEDAQLIHRVKNEFPKSSWYSLAGDPDLFTVKDVEVHRRWRRLLSYPLSETGLKEVLSQVESLVRMTIHQMGKQMETRGSVDVYKWWMCMTADVIGQLTFGESFGMLRTGEVSQMVCPRCIIRLTCNRKTSICET